jgi:mycofactocin system glycosyltransferase
MIRVALDAETVRLDGGRVLLGGTPLRLVRLTAAGARQVDRLAADEPVGDAPGVQRLARRLLDGGLAHPRPRPGAWVDPVAAGTVTVLVPVRDRAGELDRCLAALRASDAAPASLLVVDDASLDPAPVAAVARRFGATAVRRAVPGGPAAARNTGLSQVRTPVVVLLDSDVEVPDTWLSPLLDHLADPAVAAVAPRVGAPRGIGVLARYERTRLPLDLGPRPGRVAPRARVAYVPTAALVARVEALRDVGGFDAGLRTGEDVDLVWRLDEVGWTVRYEPAVRVVHPPRPGPEALARQRFAYGTAAAALHHRHPGAVPAVRVSPWSAAAWGLAAAGHPLAGAALALGATAALVRRLRSLERPWPVALRLAGRGTWLAWRPLASAVTRVWWPVAIAAAVASRRARRVVAIAAVAGPLADWFAGERSLDPVRYTALRLVDDAAYGAGVWAGCWRERTLGPLLPVSTGGGLRPDADRADPPTAAPRPARPPAPPGHRSPGPGRPP